MTLSNVLQIGRRVLRMAEASLLSEIVTDRTTSVRTIHSAIVDRKVISVQKEVDINTLMLSCRASGRNGKMGKIALGKGQTAAAAVIARVRRRLASQDQNDKNVFAKMADRIANPPRLLIRLRDYSIGSKELASQAKAGILQPVYVAHCRMNLYRQTCQCRGLRINRDIAGHIFDSLDARSAFCCVACNSNLNPFERTLDLLGTSERDVCMCDYLGRLPLWFGRQPSLSTDPVRLTLAAQFCYAVAVYAVGGAGAEFGQPVL